MTREHETRGKPVVTPLTDLLARYLERQASAHAAGLASLPPAGEVEPFEAVPVQPVEPRLAWEEGLAAVRLFRPETDLKTWKAPGDWPGLVQNQEPVVALAFCVGNYPQLIRDWQPLLHLTDPTRLRPVAGKPAALASLVEWAGRQTQFPQALLAVGTLRLSRHYDRAAELLAQLDRTVPAEWQPAWANEQAALAWHRGQADEALRMWQAQPESVPVRFNRGMASLFLGQPAAARADLQLAVDQLPADSAWHHLGRLYLALTNGS